MPGSLTRSAPADDRPDLQQALIRHIVDEQGLDHDYFGNVDRLCHLVLKEDWPRELPPKPIVLPYPSLGTLFKGRDAFLARLRASLTRAELGGGDRAPWPAWAACGKSRAAVEYAWAHRDDYTALLWLEAETPDKLHIQPRRAGRPAAPARARRGRGSGAGGGRAGLAERQSAAGS